MNKLRLLVLMCACLSSFITTSAHAIAVSGQGIWETTLKARDLDGDISTVEAYYDTVLEITWLANALFAGNGANVLNRDWDSVNNWAAGLNINGITGWRLPVVIDVGNDGMTFGIDAGANFDTANSEMGHMYYDTLGNTAYSDVNGTLNDCNTNDCLANTGPFTNLQPVVYWASTEYVLNNSVGWSFIFDYGNSFAFLKQNQGGGWAVHDGDVGAAAVPVPTAIWLFGSGLLGMIGIARCKKEN